jgi:hypothetical protein
MGKIEHRSHTLLNAKHHGETSTATIEIAGRAFDAPCEAEPAATVLQLNPIGKHFTGPSKGGMDIP